MKKKGRFTMEKNNKVQPNKLPTEVYQELENIVGKENITEDRATVETYSRFGIDIIGYLKKHGKDPSNIPACVILPGSTNEVQAIVLIANQYKVPFIPMTNGQLGIVCMPTTPAPTICIHFSRMNRITAFDEDAMTMRVQSYVDYAQVQAEAMKKGLWNGGTPLATSLCKISSQAVLAGLWQTSKKYGPMDKNVVGFTVVLPDGEILRTGSQAVEGVEDFYEFAPGPDLYSLFRGSSGA
jgi:FAD/FMN-containing dehydrogenase